MHQMYKQEIDILYRMLINIYYNEYFNTKLIYQADE
jgi:hypothetical protein